MPYDRQMDQNKLIDALGGTNEVARICQIKPGSVSGWRTNGIPRARLMFLKLLRPDLFPEEKPTQPQEAA